MHYWMRGGRGEVDGSDERVAFARAIGIPEADIVRRFAPRVAFGMWPGNLEAAQVFDRVADTQWNLTAGMGGAIVVGLRYEVLPFIFDLLGIPPERRLVTLARLGVMEREARRLMNGAGGG